MFNNRRRKIYYYPKNMFSPQKMISFREFIIKMEIKDNDLTLSKIRHLKNMYESLTIGGIYI